jgi:prepilin-type N-terminal cleavage/methylation domain-containing protein
MSRPTENETREKQVRRARHGGYTLVEIMLVVGLIGIIATMAIPNLQHARRNALETGCIEGLKQLAEAEEMYYDVYGYYTSGHDQWQDLRRVDAIDAIHWQRLAGRRGWFIKGYSIQMINLGTYPQNYSIAAWPLEKGMDLKTFFVIGDGIIRDTTYNEPINIF